MKIRVLPVIIFATVLMLTVRVGNIWDGIDDAFGGEKASKAIFIKGARAQSEKEAQNQAGSEKSSPTSEANVSEEEKEAGVSTSDNKDSDAVSRLIKNDPTLLSQAEIDLLQRLAERRESIESMEKEMEMREGLLQAAEERIDKKIAELKNFQETIEKLIKTYDEEQEAKMQALVKIYENMKPKDAARIFEELDMETLLMVSERMGARKLAPIMAKMNPVRATEVTVELSRLRNLPSEALKAGG